MSAHLCLCDSKRAIPSRKQHVSSSVHTFPIPCFPCFRVEDAVFGEEEEEGEGEGCVDGDERDEFDDKDVKQ